MNKGLLLPCSYGSSDEVFPTRRVDEAAGLAGKDLSYFHGRIADMKCRESSHKVLENSTCDAAARRLIELSGAGQQKKGEQLMAASAFWYGRMPVTSTVVSSPAW